MKLPRDMDAATLISALERFGYRVVRQNGSHLRMKCADPVHSITIPRHNPLRIGTLASIVADVATHWRIDRDVLADTLFG